jgi:hypothetical protein
MGLSNECSFCLHTGHSPCNPGQVITKIYSNSTFCRYLTLAFTLVPLYLLYINKNLVLFLLCDCLSVPIIGHDRITLVFKHQPSSHPFSSSSHPGFYFFFLVPCLVFLASTCWQSRPLGLILSLCWSLKLIFTLTLGILQTHSTSFCSHWLFLEHIYTHLV